MALIIILSIILLAFIIKFAKPLYLYCTTKVEAEEGYYDSTQHRYIPKEEATQIMERQRKAVKYVLIGIITMPLWLMLAMKFILAVIIGIGTVLFCLEMLGKGSGIK